MINVVVLGEGPWANIALDTFEEVEERSPDIRLNGFWAFNTPEEFAKGRDVDCYDSLDEVLADKELDLVNICTRESVKSEIVIKSLDAGKHVIVPPPPAFSLSELEDVISKVEETGNVFKVIDVLDFAYPFRKATDLVKKGEFGTKTFTCNLSSLTTGSPPRNLLGDAYVIVGHMIKILDDVEQVFTWLPDGRDDFRNDQNLTCVFVSEDKDKHGTWMHSFLPSLKIESELLGTDYLVNYVGTHALAFAYGATGGVFRDSPVSRNPGVYWIHWKDHKWKSKTDKRFNYRETLISSTLENVKKAVSGKINLNPSKMRKQLLGMNSIITSIKRNGASVELENAPSYVSNIEKEAEKGLYD